MKTKKSVKRPHITADVQRKLMYLTLFDADLHKETALNTNILIDIRNKSYLSSKDIGKLNKALDFISVHGNQAIQDMADYIRFYTSMT